MTISNSSKGTLILVRFSECYSLYSYNTLDLRVSILFPLRIYQGFLSATLCGRHFHFLWPVAKLQRFLNLQCNWHKDSCMPNCRSEYFHVCTRVPLPVCVYIHLHSFCRHLREYTCNFRKCPWKEVWNFSKNSPRPDRGKPPFAPLNIPKLV